MDPTPDMTFKTCLACVLLFLPAALANAQSIPHSLSGIHAEDRARVVLQLTGSAPAPGRLLFDLYPVERSEDLVHWEPFALLLRTNASAAPLALQDARPVSGSGFYRTPTNHFLTALRLPTGPSPVGVTNRLLTDPSRTNRYGIKTNSSFMATIWYPAVRQAGGYPSAYVETNLAAQAGVVYDSPSTMGLLVGTGSTGLAPAGGGPWPVVLYSHGYPTHRRQNTGKCEELASHGYVVVAVDHEDCFGTVFPDGRFIPGRYNPNPAESDLTRTTAGRLADLVFVLDSLPLWNRDDPVLGGQLDLKRIGSLGFSHGGNAAGELGRLDPRCGAVAFLEAYLYGLTALRTNGLPVPTLQVYQSTAEDIYGFANVQAVYTNTRTNIYYCQVRGTDHGAFSDPWQSAYANVAVRRAEDAMRACLVAFFDRHLKGTDAALLDNPTNTFPVLFKFKRE